MRRILLVLGLALPFAATASGNDISKVNSSVRVEAGQQVGDVSTVNGSVHIADGASVDKASTVNGSIDFGDKAQANKIGTVNGGIHLGAASHVTGPVSTTNGSIRLEQGADVGGHLSTVNGSIGLATAHVGAGISTVSGDINVGAGSHVEGGILVDKPGGWFNLSTYNRAPHVVIGPHAVVQGTLEFRRDVVLQVSDSAQIGPVRGATPVKFSGDAPAN